MKMKLLLGTMACSLFAFTQKPSANFEIINTQNICGDYLFAGETEVTNMQYNEFLYFQKSRVTENEFAKLVPDTMNWSKGKAINQAYTTHYLRHPAYRDYPVVNVSKQQAEAFCTWLTHMLNDKYQKDEKHPVAELIVRLPKEYEWEMAARGGDKNAVFPWQGDDVRNQSKKYKGQFMASFVRGRGDYMGVAGHLNDNADVTAPVRTYWPNTFGLYNMAGNVAEMVAEDSIVKGGSWRTQAMYLEINNRQPFDGKAKTDVGFRYFIEVVALKDSKKQQTITAKDIENMLVYIPSSNYDSTSIQAFLMSTTEITNRLYNVFIEETQRRNSRDKEWGLNYRNGLRYRKEYAQHSQFSEFPVVNITKESAQDFCSWLSKKYKSFEKRKYENLQFRLPEELEWEYAASGGLKLASYPWGGPYIRNSQGCFLGNHFVVPERFADFTQPDLIRKDVDSLNLIAASAEDGAMYMTKTTAYHPNAFGLYNMSGNVAEMLGDKDFLKGGSWNSRSHKLEIKSREEYTGANTTTGFRIVATYVSQ